MTTLAIDTATRTIGIGIARADEVLYEKSWRSDNFHTVELAPAAKLAFKESGLRKRAIKHIAIAIGPGSYTGLRIGLAFAKGFAFGPSLPIIPVPTLDILAAGHPLDERQLLAIIQAGRGRLNAQAYQAKDGAWQAQGEAYLTTLEEIYAAVKKPTLLCGELSAEQRKRLGRKHKLVQLAPPALSLRRPAVLAHLGIQALESEEAPASSALSPNYLKTAANLPA